MGLLDRIKDNMRLSEEKSDMLNDEITSNIKQEQVNSDAPFHDDSNISHENAPVKKAHNFRYLDELIHSGLKEIVLEDDIILAPGEEIIYKNGISVDIEGLVIDGADHIIDAKEETRIFSIEADDVVLKNIKFENGFFKPEESAAVSGGAICVVKHPLTIEKCDFTNNSASGNGSRGGAIFSQDSSLNISHSNFNDNYVFDGSGGAIYATLNGNLLFNLEDCHFDANHVNRGRGGAIYIFKGNSTFRDCTFNSNFSYEGYGAAIFYKDSNEDSYLNLEKCTFENNSVSSPSNESYYKGYGASIYTQGVLKCDKCIFKDNNSRHASAICNYNEEVEILDCIFEDTSSMSGSVILQLNEDANLSIENSKFKVPSKEQILRIVYGFCYIKNSRLCFNNVENKSYAVYNLGGTISVENSKFFDESGNKAIYNNKDLWIRKKDELEDMIVLGDDSNPVKYLKESNIGEDIKGFTYLEDLIQNASAAEGSPETEILLEADIVLQDIEKFFFEGGVEIDVDNLTIDGQCHTIDAKGLSRIFFITAKNITLRNIVFKNGRYFKNSLDNNGVGGGAVYSAHDTSLTLVNCEFINNESRVSGGALLSKGDVNLIRDCKFIENSSTDYGTVYVGDGSFSMVNCIFNKNSAMTGGGLYAVNASINLADSTFAENLARNSGGAIGLSKSSSNIKKSKFIRNTTDMGLGGGAIYNSKSGLDISNSIFERNIGFDGGAIFNEDGEIDIDDSVFRDNFAKSRVIYGEGNAIFNNSNKGDIDENGKAKSRISLKRCTFNGGKSGVIKNYGIIDISSSNFDAHHMIENSNKDENFESVVIVNDDSISKENINGGTVKMANASSSLYNFITKGD